MYSEFHHDIELVSDGVSIEESEIKSECNKKWQDNYYIACLGRLHKVKGYDILLETALQIVNIFSNHLVAGVLICICSS